MDALICVLSYIMITIIITVALAAAAYDFIYVFAPAFYPDFAEVFINLAVIPEDNIADFNDNVVPTRAPVDPALADASAETCDEDVCEHAVAEPGQVAGPNLARSKKTTRLT